MLGKCAEEEEVHEGGMEKRAKEEEAERSRNRKMRETEKEQVREHQKLGGIAEEPGGN